MVFLLLSPSHLIISCIVVAPCPQLDKRGPEQEGNDQDRLLLPGLGIISLRVIGAPSLLSALAMVSSWLAHPLAADEAGTGADWHNNQMVLGGGSSFNLSNVLTESHLTKEMKPLDSE